jgi:hypothetical protein
MVEIDTHTTTALDAEQQARFKPDDLVLGYVAWKLIGNWKSWVRRRVESISYETATSVRRRVSVDLRLIPELFDSPVVDWGAEKVHYVPIAQLRKQRLVNFDLRDEDDRALPLITKHRNATIAAAMLSIAARTVVSNSLEAADIGWKVDDPSVVEIPAWLDRDFWDLAYLNPKPSLTSSTLEATPGAFATAGKFGTRQVAGAQPVGSWDWTITDARIHTTASERDWRGLLATDRSFLRMVHDIAQTFMICVPLAYEEGRRRIVKFSYSEDKGAAESSLTQSIKRATVKVHFAQIWNGWEDKLEGLPEPSERAPEEWMPPLATDQSDPTPLRRKFFQAVGWTTEIGKFETPALGHCSSYHLNITTPNGIQIRRAQLTSVKSSGGKLEHTPQRGTRTLRSVDLHVSRMKQSHMGNAYLNFRAESSLIVRAGFISSLLTAAALTLVWVFASRVTGDEGKHTEAVATALVVIPGLLAVLAGRDTGHPLTTNMTFGLRVAAMFPGVLAVLSAGLVIAGNPGDWFGALLFVIAWLVAALFGVAWRLASRGRPDLGSIPLAAQPAQSNAW